MYMQDLCLFQQVLNKQDTQLQTFLHFYHNIYDTIHIQMVVCNNHHQIHLLLSNLLQIHLHKIRMYSNILLNNHILHKVQFFVVDYTNMFQIYYFCIYLLQFYPCHKYNLCMNYCASILLIDLIYILLYRLLVNLV